jgi:GTP-binding protein Era
VPGAEDAETAAFLAPHTDRIVAAINKIDVPGNDIRQIGEFISDNFPALPDNRRFLVSGKTGDGIEAMLCALYDMAPEDEPFYDKEYYTDQEVDFRIAEISREQAIVRLRQELPHALHVEIADAQFTEADSPDSSGGRLWVRAFIVVERESQKGIVVGKGGAMIKAIRLAALKELRAIFDWKIDLDLKVKSGKM